MGTFVLVAGDRDYIPVLQHLRRQARQVKVVGLPRKRLRRPAPDAGPGALH
ncbi:MAG: NYN domain-containing protein [Hymenobacter sp.]